MGKPANTRYLLERLDALLKLKMPQVLLDYIGHCHAQRGRKVLCRHDVLLVMIRKNPMETIRESLRIAGRKELDRQLFALSHLPKVRKIRTDDRNAKTTREVGNPAASGRR